VVLAAYFAALYAYHAPSQSRTALLATVEAQLERRGAFP
jgi:hypothetical protein